MYAARNLVNGYDQFAASSQVVRFAVAHTLVFTLFPEWLKQLNGEVGHVTARVNAVNVPEGVQQLVEGECDLLLGYHHPQLPIVLDPNHFPFVNLGVERILPVSTPDARGKPVFQLPGTPDAPLPLLAYSSGAFLGNIVEMLLLNATEPYVLHRCFETHMSEALKGMVVAGHGIGWLPESCVAKELAEGTLVCAGSGDWITGSKSACTGRPANASRGRATVDLHHEPAAHGGRRCGRRRRTRGRTGDAHRPAQRGRQPLIVAFASFARTTRTPVRLAAVRCAHPFAPRRFPISHPARR